MPVRREISELCSAQTTVFCRAKLWRICSSAQDLRIAMKTGLKMETTLRSACPLLTCQQHNGSRGFVWNLVGRTAVDVGLVAVVTRGEFFDE